MFLGSWVLSAIRNISRSRLACLLARGHAVPHCQQGEESNMLPDWLEGPGLSRSREDGADDLLAAVRASHDMMIIPVSELACSELAKVT